MRQDLTCPHCGYNLRGLPFPIARCPECGVTTDLARLLAPRVARASPAVSPREMRIHRLVAAARLTAAGLLAAPAYWVGSLPYPYGGSSSVPALIIGAATSTAGLTMFLALAQDRGAAFVRLVQLMPQLIATVLLDAVAFAIVVAAMVLLAVVLMEPGVLIGAAFAVVILLIRPQRALDSPRIWRTFAALVPEETSKEPEPAAREDAGGSA